MKKNWKKVGEAQKLGQSCQKWEKFRKFGKKNFYYHNFIKTHNSTSMSIFTIAFINDYLYEIFHTSVTNTSWNEAFILFISIRIFSFDFQMSCMNIYFNLYYTRSEQYIINKIIASIFKWIEIVFLNRILLNIFILL